MTFDASRPFLKSVIISTYYSIDKKSVSFPLRSRILYWETLCAILMKLRKYLMIFKTENFIFRIYLACGLTGLVIFLFLGRFEISLSKQNLGWEKFQKSRISQKIESFKTSNFRWFAFSINRDSSVRAFRWNIVVAISTRRFLLTTYS